MSDNEYSKIDRHLAEGTAEDNLRLRSAYGHGATVQPPSFYRFVVLETIFDPSIVDQKKIAYFEHTLQVSNIQFASVLPRNAIVARRVLDGRTSAAEPAMFLFPFFPPNLAFPCQAGEHVWVMFEHQSAKKTDLGYWMCRIVEPGFVEDVNHTHAPRAHDTSFTPSIKDVYEGTAAAKYEFRNGAGDERDGERYTIVETAPLPGDDKEYERLLTETDSAKLSVMEPVPRYKKRPGDVVLEGTNNSLIVIGRDRTGAAATYVDDPQKGRVVGSIPITDNQGPGAGAVDIVAGRGQTSATSGVPVENSLKKFELGKSQSELTENEGDPDFFNDRSRVYIAQRTRVDAKLNLGRFNPEVSSGKYQGKPSTGGPERARVQDSDDGDGAIIIKSDKVRLLARADLEILVTGYTGRDGQGRLIEGINTDEYAAVVIKSNGDIVFRPSKKGYIKLGGDDADKGVVVSDFPVTAEDGVITGPPIVDTMAGQMAGSKAGPSNDNTTALSPGQGKFAAKLLAK